MEREAARKRLIGEGRNVEQKAEHMCRGPRKVVYHDPPIELEIRQKSEGASMKDEEHSAHQFSVRDMSIQADDEEREELAMLVKEKEKEEKEEVESMKNGTVFTNSTKNRMFSSKRSTSKTHKSIITLT